MKLKIKSKSWFFPKVFGVIITHPIASVKAFNFSNWQRLKHALKHEPAEQILFNLKSYLIYKLVSNSAKVTDALGAEKIYELEAKYPGITAPVGIGNAYALEGKFEPIPNRVDSSAPVRINILLPQLDTLIMFGGYISCLQFIAALINSNYKVRILICESMDFDKVKVLHKLSSDTYLHSALEKCEYENFTKKDKELVISPNDSFIAYSFWTGISAHQLAETINREFIFFIQEYEPIFHPQDSFHAIGEYVYSLPHKAIFNTVILRDYFKQNKLGVFQDSVEKGLENSCFYQHALTKTAPPIVSELEARTKKRFLFYGRPENHAKRNLFEIALIGLKMAVFEGTFDSDDWEFVGVGTLGSEHQIELGHGHTMQLVSKMSQADYAEALRGFDVGISLMYAPHPSILPFEMSSSGIVTVTNTYGTRDEKLLKGISKNLVPCKPNIAAVANAIKEAVEKSNDCELRVANSKIDWVNTWQDSFNSDVMANIAKLIGGK